MDDDREKIAELTLLLMYLTGWEEKIKGFDMNKKQAVFATIRRTWKGYPFETINILIDQDYLHGNFHAKSVTLTEKGMAKAGELKRKYFGQGSSQLLIVYICAVACHSTM